MSILIDRKKSITFSTLSSWSSLIVHSRAKCLRCALNPRCAQSKARLAISCPVRKRSPYTTTLIAASGFSTKSPNSFPMRARDVAFPRPDTCWTIYRSINFYKSRLSPERIKQNLCVIPGRYQCKSLRDLLSIVWDHLHVNNYPDLMHSQMALNALEDWFGLYNVERME